MRRYRGCSTFGAWLRRAQLRHVADPEPRLNRPYSTRPHSNRPHSNRPHSNRPHSSRPHSNRRGPRALATLLSVALPLGLCAPAAGAAVAPPGDAPGTTTELVIGPQSLGTVSKYLFGANLLWAYDEEGAFDAAADNFYPAFVDSLKRLGITSLRYPGGTDSDSFNWQRAIGPLPDRLDNEPYGMQYTRVSDICCDLDGPAPSDVGPDEFGRLLGATGAIGNVVVNFATGTTQEAADFVAYMTAPATQRPSSNPAAASYWAALRARNGHLAPYNVPYWEVGNEQFFPGQYGWRSGAVVSVGPHSTSCPPGQTATCLYAFGGTTYFAPQSVGTFADELKSASYSDGQAHQVFYVYFPPVVPRSLTVYVKGKPWSEVANLASAGPRAHVYTLTSINGAIRFGNDVHGEIPPKAAKIEASYESGPHGGFVEFYDAMKAMNPRIHVCETEETNASFLQMMGTRYRYDCVELHEYAKPSDIYAPMTQYEEGLMAFPAHEGAVLAALQAEIRRDSARNVPVVVTEYGQLVTPMPKADPLFNLSLDEGLLIGAQLEEWAEHGVPLAEKYLLDSVPFLGTYPYVGLSTYSAMLAGPGPNFLVEPTGEVLGLVAHLAGAQLLKIAAVNNPYIGSDVNAPDLWAMAGITPKEHLDLLVLNASPTSSVRANVITDGLTYGGPARVLLLDGPSPTSFNTPSHPGLVKTRVTTAEIQSGEFSWTFPAHSVSLIELPQQSPQFLADGGGRARAA
jgi:alpha-L-arabinofuranosidase